MIFVDTGAWFDTFVDWDMDHPRAFAWYTQNSATLLTTDYVIDGLLTLPRSRNERTKAPTLADDLFSGQLAVVHFLTPDELREAFVVFTRFADEDRSFTDCASKVVMERLGLSTAFAFDQHFRQFGSIAVVPA